LDLATQSFEIIPHFSFNNGNLVCHGNHLFPIQTEWTPRLQSNLEKGETINVAGCGGMTALFQ
jgi:hypothetical protein